MSARRASARGLRAAVVVLLLGVLAGCTAIPTSGPVVVQTVRPANDSGGLAVIANPPVDGADPDDVVHGFVLAATAGGDYAVAKQYLTKRFAGEWRPNARVLVHDAQWTTEAVGKDQVVLTVQTTAEVAANGVYTPESQRKRLDFQLQQVGGQWRISSAPDGLVLAQIQFERIFRPETLRFFDPTFTRLVPDLRWFPRRADTDVSIVRATLAGRADPLSGDVAKTAFPSGAVLGGVSHVGGTTAVAVTVPGAQPDVTTEDRMQQQLSRALGILPSQMDLIVNGRPARVAKPISAAQPGLQPEVLSDGRFGALTPQGVTEDAVLGKRIAALDPTAITVSGRQKTAVVLDAAGRAVLVQPGGTRVGDRRGTPAGPLVAPSLDQWGWAWSVPADDPDGLAVFSARSGLVRLGTDLGGTSVTAIEVSPDGTRLLVVLQSSAGVEAYVKGIERGADGRPTGLSAARYPVSVTADVAVDGTWVDDGKVAVLTVGEQNQSVTVQELGALALTPTRLSNATALVGTTNEADLRALLQNGDLSERRSGLLWQAAFAVPVKVSVLAVQR